MRKKRKRKKEREKKKERKEKKGKGKREEKEKKKKMADSQLFSSTFTISDINSEKYERVSRLSAHTENGDTSLTLDVNTELLPIAVQDRLQIVLASTLSLDGTKDDSGTKGWRDVGMEPSLADEYDYVCHGKIYRFEEGDEETM